LVALGLGGLAILVLLTIVIVISKKGTTTVTVDEQDGTTKVTIDPEPVSGKDDQPAKEESDQDKPLIELVSIPAGSFQMGSPDFPPPHSVTISAFRLGVTEVTQAQYESVMGRNPSEFQGDARRPVEKVSWIDAIEFCNALSDQGGLKRYYLVEGSDVTIPDEQVDGYRLPTEAEWEYACRAGSKTVYSFGDDEGELDDYAWFKSNSEDKTHPVGQKQPNAWGLFDMNGNVWEWCQDWYGENYYGQLPVSDPLGPSGGGSARVCRGGFWGDDARRCRSAFRFRHGPRYRNIILGFRMARSSVSQPSQVAEPGA
jgi:formylglycine-generating enzyme required for sulfatase activity